MTLNSQNSGPLAGILVLDHTSALAGPYCTQLLGDLGAEVIKIERPGSGDQSRGWGPPFVGSQSAYFLGTNRNKRGMTLDLGKPEGREVFERLLCRCDVLVHNVPREASRRKLGLDADTCRRINRRLIWASISGFGNSGPNAEQPGYDVIAQGMSGTMAATGEADDPPMRFPTPIADISGGIYAAMATLAALYRREKSGEGQEIDISLLDSQVTWLANIAGNYLATGDPVVKQGNAHPNIVPYQPFPAKDQWVIVGVANESQWQRFTGVIEKPELAEDPRFASNAARLQNRQALVEIVSAVFCTRPGAYWLNKLQQAGIPGGPINTPEEALADKQLIAREMIIEMEHPAVGIIRALGNPMKLSATPVSYRLPPPLLGEHTRQILQELGYSAEEIDRLAECGAV